MSEIRAEMILNTPHLVFGTGADRLCLRVLRVPGANGGGVRAVWIAGAVRWDLTTDYGDTLRHCADEKRRGFD